MSKVTFWSSLRPVRPARSTAEMWTNTSLRPPSGSMKPKPLVALNHFTVPLAIVMSPLGVLPATCGSLARSGSQRMTEAGEGDSGSQRKTFAGDRWVRGAENARVFHADGAICRRLAETAGGFPGLARFRGAAPRPRGVGAPRWGGGAGPAGARRLAGGAWRPRFGWGATAPRTRRRPP